MDNKTTNPEELINQTKLAESVAEKIQYNFREDFLVKPLAPIKVEKEFQVPVGKTDKPKKDKNGVTAVDYDDVKTEIKEVEADYRLAVVLKTPHNYSLESTSNHKPFEINIGDVVVYQNRAGRAFDLLKDSALVRIYDIVGTMETKSNEHK